MTVDLRLSRIAKLRWSAQRLIVTESEDGAFVFTVDRTRLLPGCTLSIETQYAAAGSPVPSIDAGYVSGGVSHRVPVDVDVSEDRTPMSSVRSSRLDP
jgi:hypothetical protein